MKQVVGIICEYDPFHKGHARQFALIQKQLPDALIVCLMSGCFTQRGMPALFSPSFRAKAALHAGAAIVLELPAGFAVRDAENFARGSVSILHQLQFVQHLSFGMESHNLAPLQQAANMLENPTPAFQSALQKSLQKGQSFAAAQADGLIAGLGDPSAANAIATPNNILAICYLRALQRLGSKIQPLPIQRNSDYHNTSLTSAAYPSASGVRKAYLQGDIASAEAACGYPLQKMQVHRPDALDSVLLHAIRSASADQLAQSPDCSEGLENRLVKNAKQATSRAQLLSLLKTKRYTHTRLNRLLTHTMLGMQASVLQAHSLPSYVRLLGFRKKHESALSLLKQSSISVIAKASDGDIQNPLYQLDERAYDLWALGAGLPAGLIYRQQIVIV